jgi:outer membrane cobalamin receptor
MPEVLVVATRVAQPRSELSVSADRIPVFSRPALALDDVANLLDGELGLNVTNYAAFTGLASVGIWGSASDQVQVSVDGHPVNDAFTGGADLGMIALNGLDAAEVARGPVSSLYGANAIGGAVDFVSQTCRDLPSGEMHQSLDMGLGSPGFGSAAYLARGRYGPFGIRLGLDGAGGSGDRSNDQTLNRGLTGGVELYGSDRSDIDLSVTTTARDMGVPGPAPDLSAIPLYGDSSASSRFDRESDQRTSVRLNANWGLDLGPGTTLDFEFKPDYTTAVTSFWNLSPYAADTDSIQRDDYRSQAWGGSLLGNLARSGLGQLVLGLDYRSDDGQVNSQVNDTSWQGSDRNDALWAEAIAHLPLAAVLTASLRSDWNRDYGQALSPAIGVAWPVGKWLKLRANWGSAFRAPTLDDRYWPESGVRDIKPERGDEVQAGFDLGVPACTLSTTGFYRTTRDLIIWLPDSSGIWRPTNVNRAQYTGAEFSVRAYPGGNFVLALNATWLHGIQTQQELAYDNWVTGETRFDTVSRTAAFLPALALGGEAAWQPGEGTRFALDGRFQSARVDYYPDYELDDSVVTQPKRLAPYAVFDATISQDLFDHFQLALRFENILDTRYAEEFGNSTTDRDYPMPGRSIGLTLHCALP